MVAQDQTSSFSSTQSERTCSSAVDTLSQNLAQVCVDVGAADDSVSVVLMEEGIGVEEDGVGKSEEKEGICEHGVDGSNKGEDKSLVSGQVVEEEIGKLRDFILDSSAIESVSVHSVDKTTMTNENSDDVSDNKPEEKISESSEAAKQFFGSRAGENMSNNMSDRIDGQIFTDSEEDEGEEKMFDSAALAALLKAATGGGNSEGGNFTITSQDATKLVSMENPAGLSLFLKPLKPAAAPRANRSNISFNPNVIVADDNEINLSEEEKQKLEKLQSLRVKFLRLLQRLGHSVQDSIAAQVLYRLALPGGRQTGHLFSLDAAKKKAVEAEAKGNEDLDFSLNILVLGKAGVGKSATINSILGKQKTSIDAFGLSTTSVKEISETVGGVRITIIDTLGLKSAAMDQSTNAKMLASVKKVMKKCPPDIVLYVDRLDTQTRDLNNLPLLRTITATLGSSIWENAIVTLTHAASAPPDGSSGTPLSYDVFVAQCSHIVQQSIRQAVGDLHSRNPSLMNPVSLVENHTLCRKNREGVKVLPNGQTWRPQLLLLCYSVKVLSEAKDLWKPQEPLDHRESFWSLLRSPRFSPKLFLPNLLSWLLQSRAHPKLPAEQGGNGIDFDIETDDMSDFKEEDDEYSKLPRFKPLLKSQLAKLSKEHRKAYFDEYDYRVKLLQKKQWREELTRIREMKKKVSESEYGYPEQEEAPPASPPVVLPDVVLPPTFDSDDSGYRYRRLESSSQLLTRSALDAQEWDHHCGYNNSVIAEQHLAIAKRFPAEVTVKVTKDKNEFSIHLDSCVCAKHGDNVSTMAELVIEGSEQLLYMIKGETKFKNWRKNMTTLGGSVTLYGRSLATSVKLEDQITLCKRLVLVGNAGTIQSEGELAHEANLEIRLREADFPIGQNQSTLGLSLTKSKNDLVLKANLLSLLSIGRQTKLAAFASLDSKKTGRFTVRTSTSDHLQVALMAIVPIVMSIYRRIIPSGEKDLYD